MRNLKKLEVIDTWTLNSSFVWNCLYLLYFSYILKNFTVCTEEKFFKQLTIIYEYYFELICITIIVWRALEQTLSKFLQKSSNGISIVSLRMEVLYETISDSKIWPNVKHSSIYTINVIDRNVCPLFSNSTYFLFYENIVPKCAVYLTKVSVSTNHEIFPKSRVRN